MKEQELYKKLRSIRPEELLALGQNNPEFRRKVAELAKRTAFERYWDANRMLEDFLRDRRFNRRSLGRLALDELHRLHRDRLRLWGNRLIEFGVMTEADFQHHNPERS
jgi:hypothetical protein